MIKEKKMQELEKKLKIIQSEFESKLDIVERERSVL